MKTSSLLTALVLTAALGTALPLSAQEKGKAAGKGKAAEKGKAAGKGGKAAKSVTSELFGQLALGQKPAAVAKLMGEPESKGEKTMQEATGTSVQDWNYPAKGLTLTIEFAGKEESLSAIRAAGACTLATARGIKVGSPEADVAKAYAKERDKEASKAGEYFLAGSLYDGVSFTIKDGKVSEIFIGAGAE